MSWSKKYKKSIDCNNPKGFSQKAHCAGKKKNESMKFEEISEEILDEKLIVYNNRKRYGQVVFIAGGAGSGKGFAIKNFLDSATYKIRDVDEMKKQLQILNRLGKISIDSITKKYSKNIKPKDLDLINKIQDEGFKLQNLNLKNPNHVYALHILVKAIGIKDSSLEKMLLGKENPNVLPNILFDITAKDITDITNVIPMLKKVGYKSNNIHLTWILTNYTVSLENNKSRSRKVPDGSMGEENIMLKTHQGASNTIWSLLTKGLPKGMNGRADVILNNPELTVFMKGADGKEVEKTQKDVSVSTDVTKDGKRKSTRSEKDTKVKFPVGFEYLKIKKEGGGIISEKEWKKKLFGWIKNNAPESITANMKESTTESVTESRFANKPEVTPKQLSQIQADIKKINRKIKVYISKHPVTKGELNIELGHGHDNDAEIDKIYSVMKKRTGDWRTGSMFNESINEVKKSEKDFKLGTPAVFDGDRGEVVTNPKTQRVWTPKGWGNVPKGVRGIMIYGSNTFIVPDWSKTKKFNESVNENADYKYLTQVILDAKPKYNVYYNSSHNVVNIGGVGYDKGDLVKNFNQKPGSSTKIKNNFYHAHQDPKKTKREVEKLSKGKIKVNVDNRGFVSYSLNESVNEASFTPNSGTKSGGTHGLDNRKYELKRDVKGVQIGDYTNITLPKGTIIYNIPGGVFAHHSSLKSYQSGMNKYFNKSTFRGISVRREKNTILSIEKNSKILESVNEGFKSEYKGNDGIIWKKGKSRGDVTNFIPYYKGHDIDKGGHNFKTEKELKDFIKDYILSNQLYNKYRFESVSQKNNNMNEGKKRFYQQDGIGKAKYTISYHDGKSKHKDGSDFYGIQILKNKNELEKFRSELLKKGYREDSGFKKESVNESLEFVVFKYRDGKSYVGYYDSRKRFDKTKFIATPYGNTKDAIKVAKSLAKKNKGKYVDDFKTNQNHPDNYSKKGSIKESVNEGNIKLSSSAKKFWNTPTKKLFGGGYNLYDNIPPSQWNTHPEVIDGFGKNAGFDIFKGFIRDNIDGKGYLNSKVAKMIGLPTNVSIIDYLNDGGSGLNGNKYFKKFDNWFSALYDIYGEMEKKFGKVKAESVNEISAIGGLKQVVKGNTKEVEGIKLSKEMAQAMIDWFTSSPYGRKYPRAAKARLYLSLGIMMSFGLDRYAKFKGAKEELKHIKDLSKAMRENVNEAKYDGMLDVIEDLVSKAKSFMDVGNQLKKHKVKYSFSTSMIPMYKLDKLPIAIVNKKYVDKADREVGDIAIGLMESIKESLNEVNPSLNKKVKKYLDAYLKGEKKNSPEHQHAIMLIMKGALTDANFHSEARQLDKFFPKAKQSKHAGTQMEDVIEDKGVDIAKWAKWDGYDIIDAFSFYTNMVIGGGFGKKLETLKESINEAKLSTIHKAAKKGSYPVSLVVIKDGKVIKQVLNIKTPQEVPAVFNVVKNYHKHKDATVHIEDSTGKRLFSEIDESIDEGMMSLIDQIRQDSKDVRDFVKNVFKDSEFKKMSNDKDFIKYLKSIYEGVDESLDEKNVPTDPGKWSYYKGQAKKKFDVYPSAYANGWAAKKYKAAGGGWKKEK